MHKSRPFKVRDFRNKGFWLGDNVYLNSYAKHLDPFATAIYFSLCRHADKEQLCFPSQQLLAQEHNIGRRTVVEKLQLLEKWNIIKRKKVRSKKGKWLNNTYYLLDKSEWRKLPCATPAHGSTKCRKLPNHVQELHIKDTHIEGYPYNSIVEKITKWAYGRALGTPSCLPASFEKSVRVAIKNIGEEKVADIFSRSDNAIAFLKEIKQ